MRLIILLVLLGAGTVLAQGNNPNQPTTGEILDARWADPTTALYTIQCSAVRHNRGGQGAVVDTDVQETVWRNVDYASWLVAEKKIADLQSALLEEWGALASGESDTYRAIIQGVQRRLSAPQ